MDIHLRPMSPAVFFRHDTANVLRASEGGRERIKETFLMLGRSVVGYGGICCGGRGREAAIYTVAGLAEKVVLQEL